MKFRYYPEIHLPDIKGQEMLEWDEKNKRFNINRDNVPNSLIRIQSLEINNIKGVKHGYIELFPIGKKQSHMNKSNMLALYGQNGSGKTTVIQVLYLLKQLMMGEPLPEETGRLISTESETADIKVVFEYQREGEEIIDYITYTISISHSNCKDSDSNESVEITQEVLSLCKRDVAGKLIEKTHKLFDTCSRNNVLNTSVIEVDVRQHYDGRIRKERFRIDESYQVFRGNRDDAIESGASVLFYQGFEYLDMLGFGHMDEEDDAAAVFPNRYAYVGLLNSFAEKYFFVAGASLFNAFSDNTAHLLLRRAYVETHQGDEVSYEQVLYIARCLVPLNRVLSAIVPGLKVEIKPIYKPELLDVINSDRLNEKSRTFLTENITYLESKVREIMKFDKLELLKNHDENDVYGDSNAIRSIRDDTDNKFYKLQFFSRKGKTVTPLEDESEGIKHIIYDLDLFIAAYNDPSVTVAIDEFDAGVFEYLLGEMLKTFEQHGKGQLIFTSHNLRPLEVLDRSFICFTTTNPENRYLRMKYINQTNNLRDVYYRQILVGEQDEDLYDYVNSFELMEALDWAGEGNGQSET